MNIYEIQPAPGLTSREGQDFRTPTGKLLAEEFKESITYTIPFAIGKRLQMYDASKSEPVADEETWKQSEHYRPGLEYYEGMTTGQAEILQKRYDSDRVKEFYRQHADRGLSNTALSFMAQMAGQVADPTMFIPVVGWMSKGAQMTATTARMAARLAKAGKITKGMGKGAVEAALTTAAQQPFIMSAEREGQQDYDLRMALSMIGIATAGGGLSGGVLGALGKANVKVRNQAVQKAVDDIVAGQPVDVTPIVRPEIDRIKLQETTRLQLLTKQARAAELKAAMKEIKPKFAEVPAEDVWRLIRSEVDAGTAGARIPVKDEFGVIVDYTSKASTFPSYFTDFAERFEGLKKVSEKTGRKRKVDMGLRKNEVLNLLNKKIAGQKLTERQQRILDWLERGKRAELEHERSIALATAGMEERPKITVADLDLQPGDEFMQYGYEMRVKGIDPETGDIIIADTAGVEGRLDPFDRIDAPDEGSIARVREMPEAKALQEELAALEKEIADLDAIAFDKPQQPADVTIAERTDVEVDTQFKNTEITDLPAELARELAEAQGMAANIEKGKGFIRTLKDCLLTL